MHLGMAHVPEAGGVIAELTVDENLRLGGLWRRDRRDAAAAVDEVYQRFEPLASRRIGARAATVRRRAADARDRPRAGRPGRS